MVLLLDGNSEQFSHVWRITGFTNSNLRLLLIYKCIKQTDFTLDLRNYFWVTIWYRYIGSTLKISLEFTILYNTCTIYVSLWPDKLYTVSFEEKSFLFSGIFIVKHSIQFLINIFLKHRILQTSLGGFKCFYGWINSTQIVLKT